MTAGVTSALCGVGVAVVANIPGEGVNEYQRTGRRPDDPESWSAGLALALTAWDITTGERHGPFHPAGVPDEEWCLTRSLGAGAVAPDDSGQLAELSAGPLHKGSGTSAPNGRLQWLREATSCTGRRLAATPHRPSG